MEKLQFLKVSVGYPWEIPLMITIVVAFYSLPSISYLNAMDHILYLRP